MQRSREFWKSALSTALVLVAGTQACAADDGNAGESEPPLEFVSEDGLDLPLLAASSREVEVFFEGDAEFGVTFREADGLGPVYIRASCEACHQEGVRGPGAVQKMVLVDVENHLEVSDQSLLEFGHTVRPFAAGDAAPIIPPAAGWSAREELMLTVRVPPSVLGRGYMEAIADSEIEHHEREQAERNDGISGRINRVTYHSEPNSDRTFHAFKPGQTNLIGRFGLKARQATLDDFTADAYQGDMGLTSPMRPRELANPGAYLDDAKEGTDVDLETVNLVTTYLRLVEIPKRSAELATAEAQALFDEVKCSVCHVPNLRTRADYPIAALRDIDAPVYSDLLLHDMGPEFSDALVDEQAEPAEWRTAPLIGLRFQINYLHDGRAQSVEEAILLHGAEGSEAQEAVRKFEALPAKAKAKLVRFVESL